MNLKNEGFLLCLLSKNNEEDVTDVLRRHSKMILKESDFVSWRINWNTKSINIADIAEELDLGIDSFVFIDDNPLEREEMKKLQPKVKTLNMPESIFEWANFISKVPDLNKFSLTNDDKNKTEMYLARKNFISKKNYL